MYQNRKKIFISNLVVPHVQPVQLYTIAQQEKRKKLYAIEKKLDLLPEECIVHVLSCLSPRDAFQASFISLDVRDLAESDVLWEKFLPPDYREIMSRLVFPVAFTSKKELFLKLLSSLLIDGGNKTFSIDKLKSKKCYILSARELSITSANNPLSRSWKPLLQSRFPEGAELKMVCWLEIYGKMNTRMLSPNTVYVACLIVKIADRAYGLDSLPSEVSIEVGDYQSQGSIYLRKNNCCKRSLERNLSPSGIEGEEQVLCEREDGWLEIELGEFYNDGSEREVKMSLKEVEGEHLRGGLLVEGIELRPKK